MALFNDAPRPRALLMDLPEGVAKAVGRLFPTVEVIDDLADVHQEEWDVLVTFGDTIWGVQRHIHIIAFGGKNLGTPMFPESSPHDSFYSVVRAAETKADGSPAASRSR